MHGQEKCDYRILTRTFISFMFSSGEKQQCRRVTKANPWKENVMMHAFKSFAVTMAIVSGCMVYGIIDAKAHWYVCQCTNDGHSCRWVDNH